MPPKIRQSQWSSKERSTPIRDELPIMDEAEGFEFMEGGGTEDVLHLFYSVPTRPEVVLEFYQRKLPALGWSIRAGTDKIEDGAARVTLDAAEKSPLRMELLEDPKDHTVVRITRPGQ